MTKKERIFAALEAMGYKPKYDNDGDVQLMYQMKSLFFLCSEEDEDPFVCVIFPRFTSIPEDEDMLYLIACNKMSRDNKVTKVFIDSSLNEVSATYEFFFTDDDSIKANIEKALRILGVARTAFNDTLRELKC